MAPPGIFSFYENFDKNNSHKPSSSQVPLFSSDCFITPSIFADHAYIIKSHVDTAQQPFEEDVFGCPMKGEPYKAMTSDEGRLSPSDLLPSEVSTKIIADVSLVGQEELPMSGDTDFLKALDELELDFDDLDPCSQTTPVNTFQNFIDATLDGEMSGNFMDIVDNNNCKDNHGNLAEDDEEEDVYRKEIFMKHLGLQSVSQKPAQHKSRKRKFQEESELTCPTTSPHSLRVRKTCIRSPQHTMDKLTHGNSTPVSPVHTVPYKLCSCSSSDWQRSILYSTARSSSTACVQTSPSTASPSPFIQTRTADIPTFPSNAFDADHDVTESMILSGSSKDDFEFEFLDRGEIDQETEDLLLWLDNQENQTVNSTSSINGTVSKSELLSSDAHVCHSPVQAIDPESQLSSGNQAPESCMDLDSFVDLESYVAEVSSPPHANLRVASEVTQRSVDSNADSGIFSKSHLRLSILADVSNEILNSELDERKDAIKRRMSKSCHANHVTKTTNYTRQNQIPVPEISHRSSFSPSSFSGSTLDFSSPSSSPLSSPSSPDLLHPSPSKNLDLLDLFSEENFSMLLAGSDLSNSALRFM